VSFGSFMASSRWGQPMECAFAPSAEYGETVLRETDHTLSVTSLRSIAK
jgi:hypothetical protein